jgi:predicted nucleotidyltransferase
MLTKDFKDFVELLIKHQVEYLIIGGYAVGIHGYPRYTGDLDVWLNPTNKNSENILNAVKEFGFSSNNLTVDDFTKKGNIIQLGYPPIRIDLLTEIDGVQFKECYKNREKIKIQGINIDFISYNDLIKNKTASGRHRDLDDLENMKKLT